MPRPSKGAGLLRRPLQQSSRLQSDADSDWCALVTLGNSDPFECFALFSRQSLAGLAEFPFGVVQLHASTAGRDVYLAKPFEGMYWNIL